MTKVSFRLALWLLPAVAACATQHNPAPLAGITPVLHPCPDWSRASREDFSNRTASNFGCADAVNFHTQLADPDDAVRGRGGSAGEGAAAAAAINRLRIRPAPVPSGGATPAVPAGRAEPGA